MGANAKQRPFQYKILACKTLDINENTKWLGICYDDPRATSPDKIRYDACVTVADSFVPTQDVGVQEIAEGKYAITEYVEPYLGLDKVYEELYEKWLPQNGYEYDTRPPFEIYKNNPHTTPPEKLITEIYVPVK